ncbi:MAG: hypothetical protein LBT40_16585 [Deltaproteobacteria bacterium]|jgi:hypothetical protein|nr:hypothetical protein [Deltaproteobacteria bacterium]
MAAGQNLGSRLVQEAKVAGEEEPFPVAEAVRLVIAPRGPRTSEEAKLFLMMAEAAGEGKPSPEAMAVKGEKRSRSDKVVREVKPAGMPGAPRGLRPPRGPGVVPRWRCRPGIPRNCEADPSPEARAAEGAKASARTMGSKEVMSSGNARKL